MGRLRKIDCYGQLILTCFMIPFIFLPGGGFLAGLFCLGCWQVLSAILNTYSFIQSGFSRRILLYWTFCLSDLASLFLSYSLITFTGHIAAEILYLTSLIGALTVAIYYWRIYYKFIGFIFLRNELDGLTKSKH